MHAHTKFSIYSEQWWVHRALKQRELDWNPSGFIKRTFKVIWIKPIFGIDDINAQKNVSEKKRIKKHQQNDTQNEQVLVHTYNGSVSSF